MTASSVIVIIADILEKFFALIVCFCLGLHFAPHLGQHAAGLAFWSTFGRIANWHFLLGARTVGIRQTVNRNWMILRVVDCSLCSVAVGGTNAFPAQPVCLFLPLLLFQPTVAIALAALEPFSLSRLGVPFALGDNPTAAFFSVFFKTIMRLLGTEFFRRKSTSSKTTLVEKTLGESKFSAKKNFRRR